MCRCMAVQLRVSCLHTDWAVLQRDPPVATEAVLIDRQRPRVAYQVAWVRFRGPQCEVWPPVLYLNRVVADRTMSGLGTSRIVRRASAAESAVRRSPVPPRPQAAPPTQSYRNIVITEAQCNGLYLKYGKRLIDIIGASLALILFSPVILIFAILVKLDSDGPVFYRASRLGKGGRAFDFFKMRSMYTGAHTSRSSLMHLNQVEGPVFKLFNDPRITRIGRFMRKTSIDELPQLYNVLRGNMSLVGPRPPIPEEVEKYEPWQLRRLSLKPGITCLWQISGRSRLGFDEWMRLDMEYINNQSFWMDMRILLRTVPAVLLREGAY
jgi:exopolysaccharide biosynthesis polyprenyl glycosylphosphotransferase